MIVKILEKGVVYHSEKIFDYSAWPTVTKLNDGTIVVVFSGNRAWHICPFGKVLICKSNDGGKTWSPPQTVIDTFLDNRDGGVCVFGENQDKAFVSSFTNEPEVQSNMLKDKSVRAYHPAITDELIKLNDSYYEYLYSHFDKQEIEEKYLGGLYKISYDGCKTFTDFGVLPISAPHGPSTTLNGDLIFVGKAWTERDYYGTMKSPGMGFWMYTSENGKDWSTPKQVVQLTKEQNKYYSEGYPMVTDGGRIIVHIRSDEPNKQGTYQTISDDGGETFTPLRLVAEKGFPAHMLKMKNGNILLTYGYRFDDMGIRAKISMDDGDNWSNEMILIGGVSNSDLGYPSTIELDNETFLTVFYQIETGNRNAGIYYIRWSL